ncbi:MULTISPECIES: NAD(P)/FAD-dependent oxidoreductase [unclassified Acidisoma]|jgi:putative flavoprotein involved in K+ transport|uniref:NAD(P)/FAD-dependent oxidoreductase n=1 Tax=unclassified Acidisoma TaxID=2634065 RepID=UPI00131D4FA5|nr:MULTISPECIES: NAD(P)/FAD-dependent oxidoreductase [unclassified Acidisoma]
MTAETADVQIATWVEAFGAALSRGDIVGTAELFAEESYWRDLVSFTWNITTSEGRPAIRAMLEARLADTQPTQLTPTDEATDVNGIVSGWFTFETARARGIAYVRLREGRAWTLLTSMEELKGFEEMKGRRRPFGAEHGVHQGRSTWLERKLEEEEALGFTKQPYCVIVGGGQGGLALGARMKRLGVPTLIIEKNARAGDSWRHRYKSLCLHDPVWYDHMPYLPFPDDWPVYSPKDKIGDWLEMYARVMELNIWTSSEVTGAHYDEAKGAWEVVVDRDGQSITLHPTHLVLATGMSGIPNVIDVPGATTFRGTLHHSSQHRGGEGYRGKRCVVIGSNNSAHDICADLWEHGAAEVTMVQRSSTHVSSSESLFKFGTSTLYSEDALDRGITTAKADLLNASVPYGILHHFTTPTTEAIRKQDADLYARLEKAGFLLDFGDDGSGLFMKYIRRGSGYYIDVGASELVANGSIKLKSGVGVERITENSVIFSDGSELTADLVIYATGYGSMNGWAAKLISQDVADRVGKCWGIGSDTTKDPGPWEGELRNMWKPTQQKDLWFHGGNLHQSRHYSQYLALQIKARMEGLPTPVYALAPSHHRE